MPTKRARHALLLLQMKPFLVDKNPFPLALQFNFAPEAVARFQARLKMAETSRLRIVASAAGKHYTVFREVKVTVGGCGE